jgi:hypothetical protein
MGFKLIKNQNLYKQLQDSFEIEVGVTEESNTQNAGGSGLSMATLMSIHHFGSIENNLPPTDAYLRPSIINKDKIYTNIKKEIGNNASVEKLAKAVGKAHVKNVKEAFYSQGDGTWKELQPATIERKITKNPLRLIDTGAMLNSQSFTIKKKKK